MFIGLFNCVSFICFFHIIIHALFKSLLFLVSGSFIHYQSSFQLIYKLKVFHSFLCFIFICGGSVLIISLSKEGIIYSHSTLSFPVVSSRWNSHKQFVANRIEDLNRQKHHEAKRQEFLK